MSVAYQLNKEINDLLSSDRTRALLISGKPGFQSSVELMKILKKMDDDPESTDLFFTYHHPFQVPLKYYREIIQDLVEQYELNKNEIDPEGKLGHALSREKIRYGNDNNPTIGFLQFLGYTCNGLKYECRNLVFLFDPAEVTNPKLFNENMNTVISSAPTNMKIIVYEDSETAKDSVNLTSRADVKRFKIPSDIDEMVSYFEKELVVNRGLSDRQRVDYNHALASIYGEQGKIDKAVPKFKLVLSWFTERKMVHDQCKVLMDIGLMYYMQKDLKTATQSYLNALDLSSRNMLINLAVPCVTQVGRIYIENQKPSEAMAMYRRGIQLCEQSKEFASKADFLTAIGELLFEADKINEATKSFEEALSLDKKIGNFYGQARDLDKLAKCYGKVGRSAEAKLCEQQSKKIQIEKGFSLEKIESQP